MCHIKTKKEEFLSKTVINAAGLYADEIYKMVLKDKKDDAFDITPVRGEYYLLDKEEGDFVSHVIFQTPTSLGKGVLVSPTADGNLIVGPDANENIEGKDDLGNTNDALAYIRNRSARSVPNVNFRNNFDLSVSLYKYFRMYENVSHSLLSVIAATSSC